MTEERCHIIQFIIFFNNKYHVTSFIKYEKQVTVIFSIIYCTNIITFHFCRIIQKILSTLTSAYTLCYLIVKLWVVLILSAWELLCWGLLAYDISPATRSFNLLSQFVIISSTAWQFDMMARDCNLLWRDSSHFM